MRWLFQYVCGHIGSYAIRVISFGRIDLAPVDHSESIIAMTPSLPT